ncbi:MAG TPA: FAD:protein FMN transferase [Bryobacteraceae bacterium]|nr:FAD:protein FMN transferase [Bryobacteraceae bacterium]
MSCPEANRESIARTEAVMGTLVTIEVLIPRGTDNRPAHEAIERALGWFREIEKRCSRFDPASELMQLAARPGEPVVTSPLLFEALRFARLVAEETGGAFDPTAGHRMMERGFDREHRSGKAIRASIQPAADATWRDIELDPGRHTITLRRPLIPDLGAVAKGLAIDTATRELTPFVNFAIDAGGDLFMAGTNRLDEPWTVGIRHPRRRDALLESLLISGQAVCTSGDYERRGADGRSHILDPRTGRVAEGLASATVIAPLAMLADALATAAFVLGPVEGIRLLERMGVAGILVTPDLERFETGRLPHAA